MWEFCNISIMKNLVGFSIDNGGGNEHVRADAARVDVRAKLVCGGWKGTTEISVEPARSFDVVRFGEVECLAAGVEVDDAPAGVLGAQGKIVVGLRPPAINLGGVRTGVFEPTRRCRLFGSKAARKDRDASLGVSQGGKV